MEPSKDVAQKRMRDPLQGATPQQSKCGIPLSDSCPGLEIIIGCNIAK
jgi:hypothetical protein